MATLNRTEKLIQSAATGKNAFDTKVFNTLLDFYESLDYLISDNMHHDIIKYLYCCQHGNKTFDKIARTFNRSVSTLEDNRKQYQKMFLYFYDKLKKQEHAAA